MKTLTFALMATVAFVGLNSCTSVTTPTSDPASQPAAAPTPTEIKQPGSYAEGKDMVASLVDTHSFAEIADIVNTWATASAGRGIDCHGLLRHAGVVSAQKYGLGEVPPPLCDYGFLHGLLYGYAEVVSDTDTYVREAISFCEKAVASPGNLRDKCIHGVGHGLALLSSNDIHKSLDACDSLPLEGKYYQCTGAAVMEFGEDRLADLGWALSHSMENSPTKLTVDDSQIPTLCDGRTPTCHERYWMFLLPPRAEAIGTEDSRLATETCTRFQDKYELEMCLVGFGNLAAAFWQMFDLPDGVSYPPDSPEDADIVAQLAVARCARHPDMSLCLRGLIPGSTPQLYYAQHPYIPDFCRFVPDQYIDACEAAVQAGREQ
jgi:hypothetical protein